jgi:hypothetical protein
LIPPLCSRTGRTSVTCEYTVFCLLPSCWRSFTDHPTYFYCRAALLSIMVKKSSYIKLKINNGVDEGKTMRVTNCLCKIRTQS